MEFMDDENTMKLIDMVKTFPSLYDFTCKGYHDRRKRDGAWDKIGLELKVSAEAAKNKWKVIRDGYSRYVKRAPNMSRLTPYKFQHMMTFLAPFLRNGSDLTNSSSLKPKEEAADEYEEEEPAEEDETEMEEDKSPLEETEGNTYFTTVEVPNFESSPDSPQLSKPKKRDFPQFSKPKKLKSSNGKLTETVKKLRWDTGACNSVSHAACNSKSDVDPDEHFLLSLLPSLKKLDGRTRSLTKIKIQQILFEAEFGGDSGSVEERVEPGD